MAYIRINEGNEFMKYKISDTSKMIDIPIDTIRYYEKIGIISPERKGTYRYFSEEDIYLMCEYKKMRSYGLTPDDIHNFYEISNIEDYADEFEKIRADCKKRADFYVTLEKSMSKSVDMLKNIDEYIGKFQESKMEGRYYTDFYKNHNIEEYHAIWNQWVHDYYPFVEYIAVWDINEGESDNITNNAMWANAISEEKIKGLSISTNEYVNKIEAGDALFTVITRYDDILVDRPFLDEINKELHSRGLCVNGKLVGKMMARIKEEDRIKRYIGIWIPVREKC